MKLEKIGNKEDWKKIILRYESDNIQSRFVGIIDDFMERGCTHPPVYGFMVPTIFSIAATIYAKAYSSDNLTSVVYSKISYDLYNSIATQSNAKQQAKIWSEILDAMPAGFKKYHFDFETFNVPDFNDLTINKANDFMDYLVSQQFDDDMRKIRRANRS